MTKSDSDRANVDDDDNYYLSLSHRGPFAAVAAAASRRQRVVSGNRRRVHSVCVCACVSEYRTAAAGPVCVMVVFSVFSVSASSEIGTGRRLALSHRSIHSCHTNNNNNNISININKIARRGLVSGI